MKKISLNPFLFLIPAALCIFLYPADETVSIQSRPPVKRIVSLSPSITRQIIDLDSEAMLVGVTLYHPPLTRKIEIVGTLVQPNIEKIVILKPDIVFFSEEDNKVQFTEMLNATNIRTRIFRSNDSFDTICGNYLELAGILGKTGLAEVKLKHYRDSLNSAKMPEKKMSISIFVSNEPLIGAGGLSFIGKMIEHAGGINILKSLDQPYPVLSLEHIVKLNPDIIISVLYHDGSYQTPFNEILNDFPELTAIRNKSTYSLPLDSVCYYTPGDYVTACGQISGIINREIMKTKKNEK
ncbi:MAG: helical backbone metal receptor [Spirochaetes bacterium]|nr:helical backbone metal receptor [Spirochaetota bacterium]